MQFILFIALMTCAVITAYAIKCYSCESAYDAECSGNFDEKSYFKLDCSKISPPRYIEDDLASRNATACMKLLYTEQGMQKTVRSCFFGDVNDTDIGCRLDPMLVVEQQQCYVCDDHYCNESSTLQPLTLAHSSMLLAIGLLHLLARSFHLY